jgi:hypothetical protein
MVRAQFRSELYTGFLYVIISEKGLPVAVGGPKWQSWASL